MIFIGDHGVSFSCLCDTDSSSEYSAWGGSNQWSGVGYFPSFPATSPYVTAVGGTMGPNNAGGGSEIACQATQGGVITSGGGFSTYYPTPDWQAAVVTQYLNTSASSPSPPAGGFNPGGRGYPDLALLAVDYQVFIAQELVGLFGTSASTPLLAGMLSLLNARRMNHSLPSLGWINPVLYANHNTTDPHTGKSYYTDVTSGTNNCCVGGRTTVQCCASGFNTSQGWDPVTGFGSIRWNSLAAMFGVTEDLMPVPTAAPSYAGGSPTPGPSAPPTFSPVSTGYLVMTHSAGACMDDPVATLIVASGVAVNTCLQVTNSSGGQNYTIMNTVESVNGLVYQYVLRYGSLDCSGEYSAAIASSGYAQCAPISPNVFAQSNIVPSIDPWLHTSLPSGVVTLEYETQAQCEAADKHNITASAYSWIATGVCFGQVLYDCVPAGSHSPDYQSTQVTLYAYDNCLGGTEVQDVPAVRCAGNNYSDDDYYYTDLNAQYESRHTSYCMLVGGAATDDAGPTSGSSEVYVIAGAAVGSLVALVLAVLACCCCYRRNKLVHDPASSAAYRIHQQQQHQRKAAAGVGTSGVGNPHPIRPAVQQFEMSPSPSPVAVSTTADVRRYSVRGEETVNPMLMQAAPSPDSDSTMSKSPGTDSACSNVIPVAVTVTAGATASDLDVNSFVASTSYDLNEKTS